MRLQPNRDYVSDDVVQTPPALARRLVAHFRPRGRILEPCAGEGNFLKALRAHVRSSEVARLLRGLSSVSTLRDPHNRDPRTHNLTPARRSKPGVSWCELKRNRDFFAWTQRVGWIVTNPPWSQIRRFLQHALSLADHVVFLLTINHLWTRARLRDVKAAGFGVRGIVLLDTPKSFPQSGFQLGAVYLRRRWAGPITLTDWTVGAEEAIA
jgi:hypothetical protein